MMHEDTWMLQFTPDGGNATDVGVIHRMYDESHLVMWVATPTGAGLASILRPLEAGFARWAPISNSRSRLFEPNIRDFWRFAEASGPADVYIVKCRLGRGWPEEQTDVFGTWVGGDLENWQTPTPRVWGFRYAAIEEYDPATAKTGHLRGPAQRYQELVVLTDQWSDNDQGLSPFPLVGPDLGTLGFSVRTDTSPNGWVTPDLAYAVDRVDATPPDTLYAIGHWSPVMPAGDTIRSTGTITAPVGGKWIDLPFPLNGQEKVALSYLEFGASTVTQTVRFRTGPGGYEVSFGTQGGSKVVPLPADDVLVIDRQTRVQYYAEDVGDEVSVSYKIAGGGCGCDHRGESLPSGATRSANPFHAKT